MKKEIKLNFAPGCFDNFDGTQEELDSLIEELTSMFQSEEFAESEIVVLNKEDLTPEEWAAINDAPAQRTLQ